MWNINRNYLVFKNKGLIDFESIGILGLTDKSDDDTKIGKFGSGLKYALAVMLREGIEFKIYSGENIIDISKTTKTWKKGITYEQIFIDGYETSFTTYMGSDWKLWMAIREIYCNAIDEGLIFVGTSDTITVEEDTTTFAISIGTKVSDIITNWDNYFSNKRVPCFTCDIGEIFVKDCISDIRIYRKGILCHTSPEQSIFDYNFYNVDINESRNAIYHWMLKQNAWNCLFRCNDEIVIAKAIGNVESVQNVTDLYEFNLQHWYTFDSIFSKEYKSIFEAMSCIKVSQVPMIDCGNEDNCAASIGVLPDVIVEHCLRSLKGHYTAVSGYSIYKTNTIYKELENDEAKAFSKRFKSFLTKNRINYNKDVCLMKCSDSSIAVIYNDKILVNVNITGKTNAEILLYIFQAKVTYTYDRITKEEIKSKNKDKLNIEIIRANLFLEFITNKVL